MNIANENNMVVLEKILTDAISYGASDIHIQIPYLLQDKSSAISVYFRIRKQVLPYIYQNIADIAINFYDNMILALHTCMYDCPKPIAGESIALNMPLDERSIGVMIGNIKCRLSIFRTAHAACFTFRILQRKVPTLESINAPHALPTLCEQSSGLILVCGTSGAGKSTTIAAMIHHINMHAKKHILTLEDPIEYIHTSHNSLINQREIGKDSHDFESALIASLRQDPDVILIGEILNPKVLELAIAHALSGHLVITSFHAHNCMDAISRIIGMRQGDRNVHANLAACLQGIITQRLYDDGTKLVADFEILIANAAIRALIKEDKIWQLDSQISMGKAFGMQHFSKHAQQNTM